MAKKVLFISTMNLSTNPRIFKEIKLAHSLDYEVSFLGFHLGNWSDAMDKEIQFKNSWLRFFYKDATRTKYYRWLKDSVSERFNRIIWKLNKNNLFLTATASSKRTFQLLDFAESVQPGSYDLVVGHTLGTFYPALVIATKAGCGYGFDMEDYHPGEIIEGNNADELQRRKTIIKRILPEAKYISASSPLIAQYTLELCGFRQERIFSVLNYFPASEFRAPIVSFTKKIKLIWFSQYITSGRGLELLISTWDSLKDRFELTLIGHSTKEYTEHFQEDVKILAPLPQSDLHALIGSYDIGLALELTDRDLNKDSAVSNKMLAYYQAGLFILATDTTAQKQFIEEHPGSGKLFTQNDHASFLDSMNFISNNINQIRSGSLKRYQDASRHNWEKESGKLKTAWEQILN